MISSGYVTRLLRELSAKKKKSQAFAFRAADSWGQVMRQMDGDIYVHLPLL
jgi:hypothetical protein